MKKISLLVTIVVCSLLLGGCSKMLEKSLDSSEKSSLNVSKNKDTGSGSFEILSDPINIDENKLEIMATGIDEHKITYIYVANKEVLKKRIKNDRSYSIDITDIKDAHSTDYKPKVQLVQYEKDNEDKDFTTFKQERYTVKE